MKARSCNHCCIGKAISIAHSQFVFVALVVQHAMRMRHIVICGLPRSTIFFPHYLINGKIFGKKVIEHKIRVLIFSTNICLKKVKGKGRLWVLQHWCLEAYCTLTRISSFIHLQRRCTYQAA